MEEKNDGQIYGQVRVRVETEAGERYVFPCSNMESALETFRMIGGHMARVDPLLVSLMRERTVDGKTESIFTDIFGEESPLPRLVVERVPIRERILEREEAYSYFRKEEKRRRIERRMRRSIPGRNDWSFNYSLL